MFSGHYGVACGQCHVGQARSSSGKCLPCKVTLSTTSIVGVGFLYFCFSVYRWFLHAVQITDSPHFKIVIL